MTLDLIDLSLTVVMLILLSFVLGATLMWSLEGKRRDRQPLWLVLTRGLLFVVLATKVFLGPEVRGGVIEIDRGAWIVLGTLALSASLVALAVELRQRRSGGGEPA